MNLKQYNEEYEKLQEKIDALEIELSNAIGDLEDLNEWYLNHGVEEE